MVVPRAASGAEGSPPTIGAVQFRQIVTVVVALIAIVGAGLFVVSWGDDDDGTEGDDAAVGDASSTTTSTSSTSTSTTTTTIPTRCTSADAGEPPDTTTPDTTTTVAAIDDATEAGDGVPVAPLEPTLGENSSVSTVGLDTVTFGLTVFQAEQAAGTEMVPCEPVGDCYRVTPTDAPAGISFVVTEGTIERVDIAGGPITTRSGIGIGSDESRIVELFGDSLERQVNDDSSVDLIFVPSSETDADFRVVFTIRDGVVETFRSGRVPLVLDTVPCN